MDLAACQYGHANLLLGYTQYDNHDSGFIVPLPVTLMEKASGVGFARLNTLCGADYVLSLLDLKRSSKIDWGYYIGDELLFLEYEFKTGVF